MKTKIKDKDPWPRCPSCDKKTSGIPHKCPLDGVLGPETNELCYCCDKCTDKCADEV